MEKLTWERAWTRRNELHEYKAYRLDRFGRIVGRVDLLCENEEDAIRQALLLVGIHSIEIWKEDKLIARFESLS